MTSESDQSSGRLTDDPALRHDWRRGDDGDIDIFAYNPYDPHNGPLCVRCGEGFCHHCEPECYRYVCPAASDHGAEVVSENEVASLLERHAALLERVTVLERALKDAQGKFDRADVLDRQGRRGRASEYRILARQVLQEALDA